MKKNITVVLMLLLSLGIMAQEHMHHGAEQKADTGKPAMKMDTSINMDGDYGNMSHSYSLHLPMNRNGSGTG